MRVRIHDLSLGGCLLEGPFAIELGRRFTLRLDLPGDDQLSLDGETVRIQDHSRFAVKFLAMDEATQRRLERAIERLLASPADTGTIDGAATLE
jgi:c-di-GMP-binding flagellar brake protein YcgR